MNLRRIIYFVSVTVLVFIRGAEGFTSEIKEECQSSLFNFKIPLSVKDIKKLDGNDMSICTNKIRKKESFVLIHTTDQNKIGFFANSDIVKDYNEDFEQLTKNLKPHICDKALPSSTNSSYILFSQETTLKDMPRCTLSNMAIRSDYDLTFISKKIQWNQVYLQPFTFVEICSWVPKSKIEKIRLYPANLQIAVQVCADIDFNPESFKIHLEGVNIGRIEFSKRKLDANQSK